MSQPTNNNPFIPQITMQHTWFMMLCEREAIETRWLHAMRGVEALMEIDLMDMKEKVSVYQAKMDYISFMGTRLWNYEKRLEFNYKANRLTLGPEKAEQLRQHSLEMDIGKEWKRRKMQQTIKLEPDEADAYVKATPGTPPS